MIPIAHTITRIRDQIGSATLIAVSKGQTIDTIRQAMDAGHRVFGENRVQEAKAKFSVLRDEYPDLELHMIGPLQTNKAKEAVELFDVIQTLDRKRLAESLAHAIKSSTHIPRLYLEINIGNERQKSGIAPQETGPFLDFCRHSCGLSISGLMCIPPRGQDPAPFFTSLRELAACHALPHISMGMSDDYKQALVCGATEIRIGTALFGKRPQSIHD